MRFTIVTPSFNQLDWLRLCIASVRDQVATKAETGDLSLSEGHVAGATKPEETRPGISIEHIVQDAGTPGIEEFAREMGGDFYQDGKKVGRLEGNNVGRWECGKVGSVEGSKVGAERSETDWSEATAAERARRRARSTCEGSNVRRWEGGKVGRLEGGKAGSEGYSLTIYSEKDAGMYDAINKGLWRATGEICAYLNCDEQYLPGTLRWVADYFLMSPQTEVLFGAAIVTRADGSYVCDRRVMVPTRWHTMVSGNLSIFTSSTFFRRKSVVDQGLLFDPQWRVCGDAVWALRFLDAGLRMDATHKRLSAFAETGANLSAAANPRAAEESRRLALSAPAVARALKPVVLLDYRLRRWWSGAYALKPHQYSVYTSLDTEQRQRFNVDQPTFRWQMGADSK
jgi:glycosyltransferase involved in cell wall biosynthesis